MPSILSNFNAPAIDGQAVRRVLAPEIMNNIVQDIILRDGYGVTEQFTTDTDALEVRVVRENPLTQEARQLGATINGGYFPTDGEEEPTSSEYGIRLSFIIDKNIDIAQNMEDLFPLGIVAKTTKNLGQLVAKNINASTMAEQMASNFNYNAVEEDNARPTNFVDATFGTDSLLDALFSANTLLDEGDEENGIDIFPVQQRVAMWRPKMRAELLKTGQVIIGGSNFAQEMIARGVVDPKTGIRENMGGYFGDIDSTPQHIASNAIFKLAEKYLGLTAGDLDLVHGIVVSSMGTGRGLAFNRSVKTIDSPRGQGMRMQPKYRWGVETWFPLSVVIIKDPTLTNPAYPSSVVTPLEVIPPASRV